MAYFYHDYASEAASYADPHFQLAQPSSGYAPAGGGPYGQPLSSSAHHGGGSSYAYSQPTASDGGYSYAKPPPKCRYNGQPSPYTHSRGSGFEQEGWAYTGCCPGSKVEFYEREDGSKMDYYPTTGTVKTMLAHPRQGRTQMFRRGLSSDELERVARNPRAHTGKGYQTRKNKSYAPY